MEDIPLCLKIDKRIIYSCHPTQQTKMMATIKFVYLVKYQILVYYSLRFDTHRTVLNIYCKAHL